MHASLAVAPSVPPVALLFFWFLEGNNSQSLDRLTTVLPYHVSASVPHHHPRRLQLVRERPRDAGDAKAETGIEGLLE